MDPSRPIGLPNAKLARPKRPLSAFNLYYRFKRQKVVEVMAASGGAADETTIRRLIKAPPGLESAEPSQASDELRRERIIQELEGRTEARDTSSRSHRRAALNGGMGFVELARLMNVGWKECDDFARGVFRELADEGRERYRRVLLEYNNRVERLGLAEEEDVEKKQVEKRLPAKKRKVAEIPQSESDSDAEKQAAEIMIQITQISDKRQKREQPTWKADFRETQPSGQPDVLSKHNTPWVEGHQSSMAHPAAFGLAQPISPFQPEPQATACEPPSRTQARAKAVSPTHWTGPDAPPPVLEQMRMLRVEDIEMQLAERRLRLRLRELEYNVAMQRVKEGLLQTALGGAMPRKGPTGMAGGGALLPGGLARGLDRPVLAQPNFLAQNYAALLGTMPKQPSPVMSQGFVPDFTMSFQDGLRRVG